VSTADTARAAWRPGSFARDPGMRAETAGGLTLRPLLEADWPAVRRIYADGIAGGNATFETTTPAWSTWDSLHLGGHRLVAIQGGEIAGWAALSSVSARECYAGVAEVSVYVAPESQGLGAGTALLSRLVADAELAGIWTVQAGIFPENAASIALHRRCGFDVVGVRTAIGRLHGTWRDVVLMERRSEVIR
jgi:L-amino acid N-acyltransferase YncA